MVSEQFTYVFMFECGNFLGNDRNCTILIRTPMIIKTGAEFSGKIFRINWSRIFWKNLLLKMEQNFLGKFSNKTGAEFSRKIYE